MDAIQNLLTRGVDKIYPSRQALENVLRSGKKLRLYQGFDPTGTQLHIGHAVALRKLRQFQDLGHHVIFLIGDFTAMIGDPSGKSTTRKPMTKEEAIANAKTYKEQASRILKFDGENPVEIKHNSEWLGKMSAIEFFQLSHLVSYQQIIERDMFQERMKQGLDLFANELLYPLLQAYDSVFMDVDLEIGGSDQMFNMLMGRKLMRKMKQKEKFVLTVPLLTDSSGIKIGKTEGNAIGINDPPNEFFAKIMALGDDAIIPCFTLLTDIPLEEIEQIKANMKAGENPMVFKKQLALELTKQFNTEKEAEIAQLNFENTFQKRDFLSALIEEVPISVVHNSSNITIVDLLTQKDLQLVESRSEAKRLLAKGAIDLNGQKLTNPNAIIKLKPGDIIRVGKARLKKFVE